MLLQTVSQSPRNYGLELSRWRLSDLMSVCDFIKVKTVQGFRAVMRSLGVHYKASRSYIHSPDMAYKTKLDRILNHIKNLDNQKEILVFMDQLTFYNQPSTADAYAKRGKQQAKAKRALGAEKTGRVLGAINAFTGQGTFLQKSKITVPQLIAFFNDLIKTYPNKKIFIVLDNWPVHYHPDIIAALEPQIYQNDFKTPDSWKNIQPKKKYMGLNLPIQLLPLPTYASWLNPIEKLWKWLKKDIIHNHQTAHDWTQLKVQIQKFLNKFLIPVPLLLTFVGLNNPHTIYGKAIFKTSP